MSPEPQSVPDLSLAPIDTEYDAAGLRVTGRLPEQLRGTLYRNGPNPQFPDAREHWFLGDGMVHAFDFADDGVSYRNRWVRTERWRAERQAGRRLADASGFGRPAQQSGGVAGQGKANTHVLAHAGRLLALEEAHLPFELDARALESIGPWNAGGALQGPFTAHPKVDPESAEMVFFGYAADGPLSRGIVYGELDAQGRLLHRTRFEAPYCSMVHDFAVTRNHVLLPVLPLQGDLDRARAGGPAYAWRPELGSHLALLARKGDGRGVRWFEGPPCYVFHVLNAWEEDAGRRLHADVMRYDEAPLFPRPDGSIPAPVSARLVRWSFDLDGDGGSLEQTPLGEVHGEFPRIDERRAGLPYRHGWACADRLGAQRQACAGLVHVDLREQRQHTFWGGPGERFSEPVFVARAPDAPEGDGWLLALVHRPPTHTSDLLVFDATALDRGPLATVHLSHRVPAGFHGSWVGAPRRPS
jgi:carotenoid cleavage dioxygenase